MSLSATAEPAALRRRFQSEFARAMLANWAAQFLTLASTYLLLLLPRLLDQDGVSATLRGCIMATFTLGYMAGTLTSERTNSGAVIGCCLAAAGCLSYTLGTHFLPAYFVGRAIHGFGCAWVGMALQGWLLRTVHETRRGRTIGIANLPVFVTLALSPFVSEALSKAGPSSLVFLVAAGMCLLLLPVVWRIRFLTRVEVTTPAERGSRMHRLEYTISFFLFAHGFSVSYAMILLPVLTAPLVAWAFSLFFLSYGITAFLLRAFIERPMEKWFPAGTRALAGCLVPLGTILLAFSSGGIAFVAIGVLFGIGHALFFPSLMQLAIQRSSPAHLVSLVGKLTAIALLGSMLGEALSGVAIGLLGLHNACMVGGMTMLVIEIGLLAAIYRIRKRARARAVPQQAPSA